MIGWFRRLMPSPPVQADEWVMSAPGLLTWRGYEIQRHQTESYIRLDRPGATHRYFPSVDAAKLAARQDYDNRVALGEFKEPVA